MTKKAVRIMTCQCGDCVIDDKPGDENYPVMCAECLEEMDFVTSVTVTGDEEDEVES